ncbi:MAG: NAD-dependent epimerase/dehydratase family protein [Alphaproteobacteria bacterium]|jgi:nucleoside-diphosphate-sugar epimerase
MLTHGYPQSKSPARVVMLGANGFIAQYLAKNLAQNGIALEPIGSKDIDLSGDGAHKKLSQRLAADDCVVILSAITPDKGKDIPAFMANMAIGQTICLALQAQPVAHVIYISSDAVYPFGDDGVNEDSAAAPTDLYSAMHRAREIMISASTDAPFSILRPTMVFGPGDTHNSYGPNWFHRQGTKLGKITLGGYGEETRDHIFVEDVASLISRVVHHRSQGILNLVTGASTAFMDLAKTIASLITPKPEIKCTPRQFPITHRHFDARAIQQAFPDFQFTPMKDALAETIAGSVMDHRK